MKRGEGEGMSAKEESMLRLVATLIVQTVLKRYYERNRICEDQQEGSVGVLSGGPGGEDSGVLHEERAIPPGRLPG